MDGIPFLGVLAAPDRDGVEEGGGGEGGGGEEEDRGAVNGREPEDGGKAEACRSAGKGQRWWYSR